MVIMAVGDRMFLGMQDFNFAQFSSKFCPIFALICPAQKIFARGCSQLLRH